MKYYDVDGDGSITYEEFLNGLRDELTQRRYLMVEKAWNIMDKDNSGKITVTDICIWISMPELVFREYLQRQSKPRLSRWKENQVISSLRFP